MEKSQLPTAQFPPVLADALSAILELATRDMGGIKCGFLVTSMYEYCAGKPTIVKTIGSGVGKIMDKSGLELCFEALRTNENEEKLAIYNGIQFVPPKERLTTGENQTYAQLALLYASRVSERGKEYHEMQQR